MTGIVEIFVGMMLAVAALGLLSVIPVDMLALTVAAVGFARPARVMAMQRLIASGAAYPPAS